MLKARRYELAHARLDPASALARWLKLSGSSQGFVIEKTDAGQDLAFVAAAPFEVLRAGPKTKGNAFDRLGRKLASYKTSATPYSTGAFGYLAYEMSRHLEALPARLDLAEEALLMLFPQILVLDRRAGRAFLTQTRPGKVKAEALVAAFGQLPPALSEKASRQAVRLPKMKGTLGRPAFLDGVRELKRRIRAGDIFQGVLSESFTLPVKAAPLEVYRTLRRECPSPYLFLLKDGESHILGASPERLIAVEGGLARNCPIAGTRPRGKTAASDKRLERAMVRSPKERAEHLMLVDLARNDLGRVCRPGTIKVSELLKVRRFSNVMHLVSEVEGRLEEGVGAWDALKASFPAGTVSGAPKVRAMELLAALEPKARGFYAGAVIQADFSGNLDSCLAIRSMSLKRGVARLQAGAGIVADSSPEREYQEVLNKLAGLRRALALL
ncbi:MAG: anthranilate synthase component I family protein [Elusimicrobiota bacterium]